MLRKRKSVGDGVDNPAFLPTESEQAAKVENELGKQEDAEAEQPNRVELKRELGLFSGIALIVGTMIGSGIFVSPGGVLKRTGSVGASLLVWAGCGIVSSLGAICYIELGCLIPQSGAETVYIKAGLGDFPSFMYSWMRALVLSPSGCAIISLAFSEYILTMVPGVLPPSPTFLASINATSPADLLYYQPLCEDSLLPLKRLIALSSLFLITFINAWSVRMAAQLQNVFTVAKLGAILIIIGGGIYRLSVGYTEHLEDGFKPVPGLEDVSAGSIALAFYSGLWSYDGWNQLNFVTEELQDPLRNLPLAILIGMPMVTLLYIGVNISYLTVLSPIQVFTSDAVAVEWSDTVLGVMAWVMPLSVAFSTFGALNGSLFSSGRLVYVASREGHLPRVISYVNVGRLTPAPALIFNTVIASGMIFMGNIGQLIDFFSFTAWIFYGMAMLSLLVMRRTRAKDHRPFKVWIVIPIFILIVSCYFVVAPIIEAPAIEYLYVGAFVLVGALLYVPCVRMRKSLPGMGAVSDFLQLALNIAPPEYDD